MDPSSTGKLYASILVPYSYKSPLFSALLSTVIPGAGQVRNGQFLKGFIFLIFSPLIIPYFIGIWDAYYSTRSLHFKRDLFILQTILDALEEKTDLIQIVQQVTQFSETSGEHDELVAQTNFGLMKWESSMIQGAILAGLGLHFEIAAFTYVISTPLALTGIVPLLGGLAYIVWKRVQLEELKQSDQREEQRRIEKIVNIVERYESGVISVSDLVSITNLAEEEAVEILDKFVVRGYAKRQISNQKTVGYRFSTELGKRDK